MKLLTVYEFETETAINIETIEAVIKNEEENQIKIVCNKYCYVEQFNDINKKQKRYDEIIAFLKKDGEFE
jgi:hypothetical protein